MTRQLVVLYNPKSVFFTMPLALVAVGSALDPQRYDVRIVDARLERDPVAAALAAADGALCFGVTVLTGAPINDALRVSHAVRARYPNIPIVWGGWHPSLFPAATLEESPIDITVQGQGEATFAELVECLSAGRSLDAVHGITFRRDGAIIRNPARTMVDMNSLPRANYDLIPVERYFALKGTRQLDYISSAGCYFRCAFCADPFVNKRAWTAYDPVRIADELEDLWWRYAFVDLAFQDETFFTHPDSIVAMSEELLRRGLKFTWTATLRADQGARMADEMFATCVRAGLRWVLVGVESGSQEMLDWMKKDITIEQVITTAEKCLRHGVAANFPFIVGFPGETDASIAATLAMIKRLRAMSPNFSTPIFYFKPYPGSDITRDVEREGYRLPRTLQEWATFDYVDSDSGPWVAADKYQLIERFKFYNRLAWGRRTPLKWPLGIVARWRCKRDFYGFPFEKTIVERVAPREALS